MGKKQDFGWRHLEGGSLVLVLAPLGCVFCFKQCSFKKRSCQHVDRVGLVQEVLARNASLQRFTCSAFSLLERLRQSSTSDFSVA